MKVEAQKSGHVFQRYILDKISERRGEKVLAFDPLDVVVDSNGSYWLCEKGTQEEDELEERGCYRCIEQFIMK